MRKMCLILPALFVLVPAAARAQLSVGARTGYAIPLGDADGSAAMSDVVSGQIPLHLDVDYRWNQVSAGLYFAYGFGDVAGATKDLCSAAGASCSSSTLHIGGQVQWRFEPQPTAGVVGPWLGIGLGYDAVTLKLDSTDLTMSGTEFIFQGGHDWQMGPSGSLGLFASLSFGQYSDISGGGVSGTLADKKVHEWLTLGVRGSFGFPK